MHEEAPKARKEEILDVATRLFAERGYEGASMNDVAEQVGMRKASLFYHFATKDALYEAVIDRLIASLHEPLEAIYASSGTYAERLDALTRTLVEALGSRPYAARLLLRETMDWGPVMRGKLAERILLVLEAGASWIRAGQEAGRVRRGRPSAHGDHGGRHAPAPVRDRTDGGALHGSAAVRAHVRPAPEPRAAASGQEPAHQALRAVPTRGLRSELAVPARATGEARRARHRLARDHGGHAQLELAGERGVGGQRPLLERAAAVGAQTLLREGRQARGERLGFLRALPDGTTRLARPQSSASRAGTARPVRIMSAARDAPMSRGSRTVPPSISGTPQRRQKTPKVASSSATRRSHQRASSRPPATA